MNGDPSALALVSQTASGIPCYVVHEESDPYNSGSDPMALVSCKPLQPGDSFAQNSAWFLSLPIYTKKQNSFSLEAANAPNNFLRRAYEYARLSAFKYLAISDFTLVEGTFFIAN